MVCQIPFCQYGLVGVDVKSHQSGVLSPWTSLCLEMRRRACAAAKSQPLPDCVRLPSGGPFAFLCYHQAMVTSPTRSAIRGVLRQQALMEWRKCPVQGKIAAAGGSKEQVTCAPESSGRCCHISPGAALALLFLACGALRSGCAACALLGASQKHVPQRCVFDMLRRAPTACSATTPQPLQNLVGTLVEASRSLFESFQL